MNGVGGPFHLHLTWTPRSGITLRLEYRYLFSVCLSVCRDRSHCFYYEREDEVFRGIDMMISPGNNTEVRDWDSLGDITCPMRSKFLACFSGEFER